MWWSLMIPIFILLYLRLLFAYQEGDEQIPSFIYPPRKLSLFQLHLDTAPKSPEIVKEVDFFEDMLTKAGVWIYWVLNLISIITITLPNEISSFWKRPNRRLSMVFHGNLVISRPMLYIASPTVGFTTTWYTVDTLFTNTRLKQGFIMEKCYCEWSYFFRRSEKLL